MSLLMKPTKTATMIAAIAFTTAIAGCGSSATGTATPAAQIQTAAGQVAGTTPGVQGTTPSGVPQGTTPAGGQGGGPGGMDTAALAKALGVSEAKLTASIANSRPSSTGTQGTTPGAGRDMTAMFAQIAKDLGLSTAKVQEAFDAQRPAGGPPQGTPPAGQVPRDGNPPAGTAQSSAGTT